MNLPKVKRNDLIILISPWIFFAIFYFLLVPPSYLFAGVSLYYLVLFFYPIYTKKKFKDDAIRAWDFVRRWWWDFRREDLTSDNAEVVRWIFGNPGSFEKFFAFKILRGPRSMRPWMKLVVVVSMKGPEVVYFKEDPNEEVWENPFSKISPVLKGAPSPYVRPELHPELRPRITTTKKRKKEEEVEEEGEYHD